MCVAFCVWSLRLTFEFESCPLCVELSLCFILTVVACWLHLEFKVMKSALLVYAHASMMSRAPYVVLPCSFYVCGSLCRIVSAF